MERLTVKGEKGWQSAEGISTEQITERLAAFENMYEALEKEIIRTESSLDKLKAEGKTKSATFRQLLAEKLKLSEMIKRCDFWF